MASYRSFPFVRKTPGWAFRPRPLSGGSGSGGSGIGVGQSSQEHRQACAGDKEAPARERSGCAAGRPSPAYPRGAVCGRVYLGSDPFLLKAPRLPLRVILTEALVLGGGHLCWLRGRLCCRCCPHRRQSFKGPLPSLGGPPHTEAGGACLCAMCWELPGSRSWALLSVQELIAQTPDTAVLSLR